MFFLSIFFRYKTKFLLEKRWHYGFNVGGYVVIGFFPEYLKECLYDLFSKK